MTKKLVWEMLKVQVQQQIQLQEQPLVWLHRQVHPSLQ
jgi:hypothetical protein